MVNDKLYLSQSMLKEYETMCPLAFSKRWFGTEAEKKLFDRTSDAMNRGVLFETLAIGSGVGGKVAKEGDVDRKSVYHSRIVQQAKLYQEWEKEFASKAIASQQQIQVKVEWEGGVYYAQGNLDRLVRDQDGMLVIIDLKLTGDKDNDYGDFQWARTDKIDYTQLIHYRMLAKLRYDEEVRQMYYVADCSSKMGLKPLEVIIPEWKEQEHHARCQAVYNEIVSSSITSTWRPQPSQSECSKCPLGNPVLLHGTGVELCKHKQTLPEIEIYEIY